MKPVNSKQVRTEMLFPLSKIEQRQGLALHHDKKFILPHKGSQILLNTDWEEGQQEGVERT